MIDNNIIKTKSQRSRSLHINPLSRTSPSHPEPEPSHPEAILHTFIFIQRIPQELGRNQRPLKEDSFSFPDAPLGKETFTLKTHTKRCTISNMHSSAAGESLIDPSRGAPQIFSFQLVSNPEV